MFKLKRIFLAFSILILLLVGIALAGDGTSKGNVFQTITGFLTLALGGGGAFVYSKIKLIKDLREAIASLVQLFGAIQVLIEKLPDEVKSNPVISNFLRTARGAAEETADVLEHFKSTKKWADWLRSLIKATAYTNSAQRIELLKQEIELDSDITDAFKEAMAKMK
jgi:cell fate (sporulation/competence/biofilm development) regulator YmcA (YheA/YmcA/DUF963 family)